MEQPKTAMSVVSQNTITKIKVKYNIAPCLCWVFGVLFSFSPMFIEYLNSFIRTEHTNLYLTLFGNKEVFFICVSFSIAALFYIMEKGLVNPSEKSISFVLYVAFAILLLFVVICIGVYSKQSTNETAWLNDIVNSLKSDMPKDQLLSNLSLQTQETTANSEKLAKVGIRIFSITFVTGLVSFLDIKRR